MRILWTLIKVAVGLAIAIPLCMLALGLALGLIGLAIRVAILGAVAYGAYRVFRWMIGPRATARPAAPPVQLPPADPYYSAAMRELDAELRA